MKISQCHELLTMCKTVIHSCDNNSATYYTSNFQENINYGWIERKKQEFPKVKKYNKVGFRCDDFPYEWKQLITKYNFFKKVDKSSMYI